MALNEGQFHEIQERLSNRRFVAEKEALEKEKEVLECLSQEGGESTVAIYLRKEKAIKRLGKLYAVQSSQELLENLAKIVGPENVKEQLKSLKNA